MDIRQLARNAAKAQHMRAVGRGRSRKIWSSADDETIKRLHPNFKNILRQLPHRTRNQVHYRAKCLGITRRHRPWLASEVARLRKIYPTSSRPEVMAAFPGWKWSRIKEKVKNERLAKARRRLVNLNRPFVNEIRECAFMRNLTMVDLDALADTGTFFRSNDFRGELIPHFKNLLKAVASLDGEIAVRFEGMETEVKFYRLRLHRSGGSHGTFPTFVADGTQRLYIPSSEIKKALAAKERGPRQRNPENGRFVTRAQKVPPPKGSYGRG